MRHTARRSCSSPERQADAPAGCRPISRQEDASETLIDATGGCDPGYGHVELCATLGPATHRMPKKQRQVLCMRLAEDLTQAEIGVRLGISQMHVSRLLRRAVAELSGAAELLA